MALSERLKAMASAFAPQDGRAPMAIARLRAASEEDGFGVTAYRFLRGDAWLGRPLHPMLTYLPLGGWLTGAVLDAVGASRAADRAMKIGTVAAVPTIITGCIDWYHTTGRARQVGWVHMVLTCCGTMLFMQSMTARATGKRREGIALSTAGLAVILVGGWIGTDLVIKFGMGIEPEALQRKPRDERPAEEESAPDGEPPGTQPG